MVELYLSSEKSYQELALSEGISNSSIIAQRVNNFRTASPDTLRPKKKGCKKSLNALSKKTDIFITGSVSWLHKTGAVANEKNLQQPSIFD